MQAADSFVTLSMQRGDVAALQSALRKIIDDLRDMNLTPTELQAFYELKDAADEAVGS